MDNAALQHKVYSGYGKAALRVGKIASIFRPTSALAPITTQIGTVFTALTQNFEFSKFNKYGQPTWTSIHDGSLTQAGDYLRTPDGTWFIAAQQPILPILAVECNRTISISRAGQSSGHGVMGYGGGSGTSTETALMVGWPASVLQGTKGEKNPALLPGDERIPWWLILVPEFSGIIIKNGDIIKDDLGRRYIVSSPELTDLGWRLTASMQGA